jgi:broad specificity phosphatase PhoE
MSTLVLVRHAQATPFEKITDQLSKTGEQQAALLGDYWRQRGITFDDVYCGTFQRHAHTAEIAGFPTFERCDTFNEYSADRILRALPDFAPPTDNRHLQGMLDRAMPQWISGALQAPGLESFSQFRERVTGALRPILDADRPSRRVAVFTSAGPIGVAVQSALKAPEAMAIELNWRIRNCSLTEFVFTRGRISLDSFNVTPHLSEVTFR